MEPMPMVLEALCDRLVRWQVLPRDRRPDTAIINVYEVGKEDAKMIKLLAPFPDPPGFQSDWRPDTVIINMYKVGKEAANAIKLPAPFRGAAGVSKH